MIDLPTETEVGRVFIVSLVAELYSSLPDAIFIYPAQCSKDQPVDKSHFAAVLDGKAVSEFVDRLAKPTSIVTAEEITPNLIFSWSFRNDQQNAATPLKGQLLIHGDEDVVRLRLYTGNSIYPKIDFVYRGTGFKEWLQRHSVNLTKDTVLPPK